VGHVECMGEIRNAYKIWLENLKEGDHSEYLGMNGRVILVEFQRNTVEMIEMDSSG